MERAAGAWVMKKDYYLGFYKANKQRASKSLERGRRTEKASQRGFSCFGLVFTFKSENSKTAKLISPFIVLLCNGALRNTVPLIGFSPSQTSHFSFVRFIFKNNSWKFYSNLRFSGILRLLLQWTEWHWNHSYTRLSISVQLLWRTFPQILLNDKECGRCLCDIQVIKQRLTCFH